MPWPRGAGVRVGGTGPPGKVLLDLPGPCSLGFCPSVPSWPRGAGRELWEQRSASAAERGRTSVIDPLWRPAKARVDARSSPKASLIAQFLNCCLRSGCQLWLCSRTCHVQQPGAPHTLLGCFQLTCCSGWGISDLPVGRPCCPGGITTNVPGAQNLEGQAPSSRGAWSQRAKGRSRAVCPRVPAGTSTAPGGAGLPRSRCWAGTESRAALCGVWHWAGGNP